MRATPLLTALRQAWQRLRRPAAEALPTPRRAVFEEIEARLLYAADLAPGIDEGAAEVRLVDAHETQTATTPVVAAPLAFEENHGQAGDEADFFARGSGYAVFLDDGDARIAVVDANGQDRTIGLDLLASQAPSAAGGEDLLASRSRYLGGDRGFVGDLANYRAVRFEQVYAGIDVRYYGNAQELEYDFVLAAGADASQIRLGFTGVEGLRLGDDGSLQLQLAGGQALSFRAPVAYQLDDAGQRREVASRYVLHADGSVGFELGAYDHARGLVIDPTLAYASYLGGAGGDVINDVAVDGSGNVYVTGATRSTSLEGAAGTRASFDVFVAKFDANGQLLARAFLGGSGDEAGQGLALDGQGHVYVVGYTRSASWGTAFNGRDTSLADLQDGFLVKLDNALGTQLYGTYTYGAGEEDNFYAVAVASDGRTAYLGGVTGEVDGQGNDLRKATLVRYDTVNDLGGATLDEADKESFGKGTIYALALDAQDNVYFAGDITNDNWTLPAKTYDTTFTGSPEGFVARLAAGNLTATLSYMSYIGDTGATHARELALDASGKVVVAGYTTSSSGIAKAGSYDTTLSGSTNGFIAKYDTSQSGAASFLFGSYFGSSGSTTLDGLAIDAAGTIYVAGQTTGGIPLVAGGYDDTSLGGAADAFLARFSADGQNLLYASYYGGEGSDRAWAVASDSAHKLVYVVGETTSTTGMTSAGARDASYNGGGDGFIAKFDNNTAPSVTITPASYSATEQQVLNLHGTGITVGDLDGDTLTLTLSVADGTSQLTATQGSTGVNVVSGSGTATLVVSGTPTQLNAFFAGSGGASLTYRATADVSASTTLSIVASDGRLTGSDSATLNISGVNDAPTAQAPANYGATEQVALALQGTGLQVGDVDAGNASVTVTLNVDSGVLNASAGSSGVGLSGSGTNQLTLTGSLAQVNALLAGTGGATLSFLNTSDTPPASALLTLRINDGGNSGSGGPLEAAATSTIAIAAVNDAPTATITPTSYDADEQVSLILQGSGLQIGDVDAGGTTVTATVSVLSGSLFASAGSSGVAVGGAGSNSLTLVGSVTQINALLAGNLGATLSYRYAGDTPPATDTLTLQVDDGGNTGGGAKTASDSALIRLRAIDDAPGLVLPVAQSLAEDGSLLFSGAGGNAIVITDADAGSGNLQVGVSVSHGTLSLAGTAGLTMGSAASNVASLSFSGTLSAINAALDGLRYRPDANYAGSDGLVILVSDLGNSGDGGPLQANGTVALTVSAVADAPVVTPSPSALDYTENGGALAIDTGIVLADVDSGLLSGATVRIGAGYVAAQDVLAFTAQNGISGNWNGATGTLSLSGTASLAAYEAALRSITYRNDADDPATAPRTLSFTVRDDSGTDSLTVTRSLNLLALNDAPTLDPGSGSLAYIENDAAAALAPALTVDDADSATLKSATLRIVTHYAANQDRLLFTDQNGIIGAWDAATGSLSLTGDASVAAYQTALRSVRYLNTSDNPDTQTRTLSLVVVDSANAPSLPASRDITVAAVNDAPVPRDDVFSSDPGVIVDLNVKANDGDPDDTTGSLTVTILDDSGIGPTATATVNPDGTIHFDPGSEANAQVIVYRLTDSAGLFTDATLTINVTPNLPPSGAADTPDPNDGQATLAEDGNYVFRRTDFGFVDPEGHAFATLRIETLPGAGTLWLDGVALGSGGVDIATADLDAGKLVYTPAANGNGMAYASFDYRVQDQLGAADPSADTFVLNVTAVDDAPLNLLPQTASVAEDGLLVFSVGTGNPIDIADVDATTLSVELSVTHGSLSLGRLSGLGFTTGDGTDDTTMRFTGSFADVRAALDGLRFRPDADYAGSAVLTLTTDDQALPAEGGPLADSDTLTIQVSAVNDAPVISAPAPQNVDEDDVLEFSTANGNPLAIGDVDAGSGELELTLEVGDGTLSLASLNGLSFALGDGTADAKLVFRGTVDDLNAALEGLRFTPTPNFNGVATLAVSVLDLGNSGSGGARQSATAITLNVAAVNDPPLAVIAQSAYAATEQTLLRLDQTGLNIHDIDAVGMMEATLAVDSGQLSVNVGASGASLVGSGTGASVSVRGSLVQLQALLNGGGGAILRYLADSDTPPSMATLSFSVRDESGAQDSQSVAIDIAAVDDATSVTTTGAPLSYLENDGVRAIDGGLDLVDVDSAVLSEASVRIGNYVAGEDSLVFVDQNGISGQWMAATGTLRLSGNASLADYRDALRSVGYRNDAENPTTATRSIAFSVSNNGVVSNTATRDITLSAVDDAPLNTLPAPQSVAEDTDLALNGINRLSVSDVDGNLASIVLSVAHGTLNVAATGGVVPAGNGTPSLTLSGNQAALNQTLATLVYRADANYHGSDTLTIESTDTDNVKDIDALGITVTRVNDAPVNQLPIAQTLAEDTDLALNGLSVADVDGDLASIALSVAHGSLNVTASGAATLIGNGTGSLTLSGTQADLNQTLATLVYRADANYHGSDTLGIVSTDTDGFTDSDAIGITVTAVNDAPFLAVSDQSASEEQPFSYTLPPGSYGDPDAGDSLAWSVSGLPAWLAFDSASRTFSGTPANGDDGSFRIDLTLGDVVGAQATASFMLTVGAVNDAPQLDRALGATLAEGGSLSLSGAMLSASDVDDAADQVAYVLTDVPAHGQLLLGGGALANGQAFTQADLLAGRVVYQHDGSEGNADGFAFALRDAAGADGGSARFAFVVTPVNDNAPVITSDGGGATASLRVGENDARATTVVASDADLPTQTLGYRIAGGADAALFSIDAASGVLRFVRAPDFEAPTDSDRDNVYRVIVEASDGAGLTALQLIDVQVVDLDDTSAPPFPEPDPSPGPTPADPPPIVKEAIPVDGGEAGPSLPPFPVPEDAVMIPPPPPAGAFDPLPAPGGQQAGGNDGGGDLAADDGPADPLTRLIVGRFTLAPDSLAELRARDGELNVDWGTVTAAADEEDLFLNLSPTQAGKVVTVAMTASVVWWAGRSAGLLTALMASVPAWRSIDPLPILARDRKRQAVIDETTELAPPRRLDGGRERTLMMDVDA